MESTRSVPDHIAAQQFGLGMSPEDIDTIMSVPKHFRHSFRFWGDELDQEADLDRNYYHISFDVLHFAADKVSVKLEKGFFFIEARQEETKDDHGWISRSFKRRFRIPDDVDTIYLAAVIRCDGVLTVCGQKKYFPTSPVKTSAYRKSVPFRRTEPASDKSQ